MKLGLISIIPSSLTISSGSGGGLTINSNSVGPLNLNSNYAVNISGTTSINGGLTVSGGITNDSLSISGDTISSHSGSSIKIIDLSSATFATQGGGSIEVTSNSVSSKVYAQMRVVDSDNTRNVAVSVTTPAIGGLMFSSSDASTYTFFHILVVPYVLNFLVLLYFLSVRGLVLLVVEMLKQDPSVSIYSKMGESYNSFSTISSNITRARGGYLILAASGSYPKIIILYYDSDGALSYKIFPIGSYDYPFSNYYLVSLSGARFSKN